MAAVGDAIGSPARRRACFVGYRPDPRGLASRHAVEGTGNPVECVVGYRFVIYRRLRSPNSGGLWRALILERVEKFVVIETNLSFLSIVSIGGCSCRTCPRASAWRAVQRSRSSDGWPGTPLNELALRWVSSESRSHRHYCSRRDFEAAFARKSSTSRTKYRPRGVRVRRRAVALACRRPRDGGRHR